MAAIGATYGCPKCRNIEHERDAFRATGGNFAKKFDFFAAG